MKCKFCNTEMKEFTKNSVFCPNKDCPHKDLPNSQREGINTREYCIRTEELRREIVR